jgi:hypothetical protein
MMAKIIFHKPRVGRNSPPELMREVENYRVELSGVTVLELVIDPDISGGSARASLKDLHLR